MRFIGVVGCLQIIFIILCIKGNILSKTFYKFLIKYFKES